MTKASGDKVKLPREVAETIERLRTIDCTNADIIYQFASGEDKANLDFANFAADNFDTLLNALVNGFEVEQTPEDIIKHLYDNMVSPRPDAYRNGIIDTLNALNIKIEGVNKP